MTTIIIPTITSASVIEAQIVGRLVTDLLATGLSITVWNGGDEPELSDCIDAEKIFATLAASDEDQLTMDHVEGGYAGWVRLVWGNDADVICDYTTKLEAIMAPAKALAEQLGG